MSYTIFSHKKMTFFLGLPLEGIVISFWHVTPLYGPLGQKSNEAIL